MIYETPTRPQVETREKPSRQASELRGDGPNVSAKTPEMEAGTAVRTQPRITAA